MAQPPRSNVTTPVTPVTSSFKKTKELRIVDDTPLFGKANLLLMIIGAAIIILGMVLMAGGRSSDPKVFDYNQVYSKIRITVAPILIIIGIMVEVVAIFRQPKSAV